MSIFNKQFHFNLHSVLLSAIFLLLFIIPVQSVFATDAIARRVEVFCAPTVTMPDVNSCSACHSTTTNRGTGDLTAAGMWALARQDSNFCPSATPPPPTGGGGTGTPPAGGTGMGMGSGGSMGSMGMGMGASMDDDDDDDDDHDDDDDDMVTPMPVGTLPPA